jgi:hypothetical protein
MMLVDERRRKIAAFSWGRQEKSTLTGKRHRRMGHCRSTWARKSVHGEGEGLWVREQSGP